jgi:threonine/homoserine/homoserine lactone efflux protein
LTIQRTLRSGWQTGMISGLGVATADALYGLLGGLGLTVFTSFLVDQQVVLRLVGGLVLLGLGLKTMLAQAVIRSAEDPPGEKRGMLGAYASILLLTLSNPMTIMSFAAIYVGFIDLGFGNGWIAAGSFGLAIFLGSSSWWLVLVSGISFLRDQIHQAWLTRVNIASGILIAGFGIRILLQAFIPG